MNHLTADSLAALARRLRRLANTHQHGGVLSPARVAELLHQEADLVMAMVEQGRLDEAPTLVPEPEPARGWALSM